MGIGQPAVSISSAASRGVAAPTNVGSGDAGTGGGSAPVSPMNAKGAAITIAAMAGLLVAGNLAQQKDALPVGDGLLKIRPFNVVAVGVSAVLFITAAKYLVNKMPVPGLTDVINAV